MSVLRTHDAFSLDSARRRFLFKDDFLGDQLQDLWRDTGNAGGSAAVIDAQTGGIVRLTTDGDNSDNWFMDWNDIDTLIASKNVCIETRVKVASITAMDCEPCQILRDANNFITFVYNSTVDGNWHIATEAGGASTNEDSGIAADTDYHIFRIEITATSASFFIDDVECANSPITTNIPANYLSPFFLVNTREAVAKTMDIDYIVISQER